MNTQDPQIPQNPAPVAPQEPLPLHPEVPHPMPQETTSTQPVIVASGPEAQAAVSGTPAPRKLNIPKLNPKDILPAIKNIPTKFKVMAGVVFLLLFLMILVSFTAPGKKVKELILPSPSVIPQTTPVGEVFEPSPYAQDSEVLDVESKVGEFDKELSKTNLREDNLRVPNLDWNVNFKE